ncbi:peptide ABC transporter substrate-binding protein [Candidatus Protochlamydia amoebophila]|uniref:Solute-binding protein family 5 domain-containing protein n=1 Tax=Protochlamydia amoebophila (strain UWE25) TaxID=264201 RepID=Q6MB23_PARUW|nr:peptide ABC transporter substrate-binding protein [Candidatus Protochlamydia amoebophila]CAF24226.1 unnamed protein product [Candidatus Protochlamydia amoebophila UWE25]
MLKKYLPIFFLFLIPLFTGCDRKIKPTRAEEQIFRISCESDLLTLDPRLVRDLGSITVMQALYEGLTRIQADGTITLANAETVTLSPDHKTYTFKLRSNEWSNGDPVTAYDFEESWKSVLSPQFPSPNAYQLYVIKGAQEAKEGTANLDQVGIYAKDKQTLIVELKNPTPYFLNLTATHFFFPVHAGLRNQPHPSNSFYSTNGPFKIDSWTNDLSIIPHVGYWDNSAIKLNKIIFNTLDNPTALQLFQNHKLDWTGSPLSTISIDALIALKKSKNFHVTPAAGIHLFRVNTSKFPLDQIKIRQALALALNRKELVEHVLQGNQEPATGLVPPTWLKTSVFFQDGNDRMAQQLFNEALKKNNLGLQNFPKLILCYASGERPHKIAQVVQQQWKNVLGINVQLQAYESKVYFDLLKKQDYQIGIGSWYADFRDPISFLDVFKFRNNGTNNTGWENQHYIDLLTKGSQETSPNQRNQLLIEAEKLLIQEMPIIPLFFGSYNYLKKENVHDVYFSELGYLDLKKAYLSPLN